MNESATSLKKVINIGLSRFKRDYTEALGESFASETSNFIIEANPAGNLHALVLAVSRALRGIHDRGEEKNPLWDVEGVCLFWTTTRYNAC